MPSRAAALRSLTHDVPPTLEMHGVFWMYGKSFSRIAPMQKSATSARAMEPASPSMTLMTPARVAGESRRWRAGGTCSLARARFEAKRHGKRTRRLLDSKAARPHDAPLEVPAHAAVREERLLVVLVREDGRHDRHHEHLEHERGLRGGSFWFAVLIVRRRSIAPGPWNLRRRWTSRRRRA